MISLQYGYRTGTSGAFTMIPMPTSIDDTRGNIGGTFTTGGGQETVDSVNYLITWTLGFTWLIDTERAILDTLQLAGTVYFTPDNGTTIYTAKVQSWSTQRPKYWGHNGTLVVKQTA